jgi:hypothetical protein
MKNLFVLNFLIIIAFSVNAQYGNFRKYQIEQTGYYCYLPTDPGKFDEQHSQDGQLMYTKEVYVNDITFGIITVFLNESFANSSADELKSLLVSYMEFLKQQFEITGAAGYGYGHTLESNPKAQGVLDYWEDKDGKNLVVKGWIDNKALAFLFVMGIELPNQNVQSMFLNGFVFKK